MNAKKQRVLSALLSNPNQRQAAKAAGVSERTVYEFLHDPDFSKEYRQARDAAFEQASRSAERAMNPALDVLLEICQNDKAPFMARVSAAVNLVKIGREMKETGDILQRLEALEDAQQNHKNPY